MLSDRCIKKELELTGGRLIQGMADPDLQIQPNSVDLTLGDEFQWFPERGIEPEWRTLVNRRMLLDQGEMGADQPLSREEIHELMDPGRKSCIPDMRSGVFPEGYVLRAGAFCLGTTRETIGLPDYLHAQVNGRSSLGRLGIVVHVTAGFCDAGWEGQVTLEFYNCGPLPVLLRPGMRICQLALLYLTTPAERPYGHESRGSKYQNQQGTTASRIAQDRTLSAAQARQVGWTEFIRQSPEHARDVARLRQVDQSIRNW